jgi:hypothetical protein
VTGGAGTICSMQTRALVRLGADACIIGRSVDKTEAAAKDIAKVRPGAKVLGIGGCDVRKVRESFSVGELWDHSMNEANRWSCLPYSPRFYGMPQTAVRKSWAVSILSCKLDPGR